MGEGAPWTHVHSLVTLLMEEQSQAEYLLHVLLVLMLEDMFEKAKNMTIPDRLFCSGVHFKKWCMMQGKIRQGAATEVRKGTLADRAPYSMLSVKLVVHTVL